MSTIVVGVDNSPRAPAVLAAAVEAAREGDELLILRVIGLPVELPSEVLTLSPDNLLLELTEIHKKQLAELVKPLEGKVKSRAEARHGAAWQVLTEAARETQARLVVVGTHGHNVLDRMLGTTASRVVNHAPCSVLAVRA